MSRSQGWNRRQFLRAGAATTAAVTIGCTAGVPAPPEPTLGSRLHTPLCDLLGIRYPILQSGMAPIGGPELAAAVSEAGGLGILGLAHQPPEEVRNRIREVRRRTDKPFGANLLLHTEVWPPVESSSFSDDVIRAVQAVLNRFRVRLGLAPTVARPATRPDHVPGAIEVMLEERVPVFSVGLGDPPADIVARFHEYGGKVVAMVATPDDARQVAASGVDAIVAQGHEAGGHRSTWTKRPTAEHAHIGTLSLVPQVVDAVDVPVLAAGGISDGRGIAAALALGAQGVMIGTRFVASAESRAVDFYKHALTVHDSDSTTVTDAFSGLYARVLRNRYVEEYRASGAPVLTGYLQISAAGDVVRAASEQQNGDYYPFWAGQGVGMIRDVRGAGEILREMVEDTRAALSGLPQAVGLI